MRRTRAFRRGNGVDDVGRIDAARAFLGVQDRFAMLAYVCRVLHGWTSRCPSTMSLRPIPIHFRSVISRNFLRLFGKMDEPILGVRFQHDVADDDDGG